MEENQDEVVEGKEEKPTESIELTEAEKTGWAVALCAFVVLILMGGAFSFGQYQKKTETAVETMHKRAIASGFATYDREDLEFTWLNRDFAYVVEGENIIEKISEVERAME